MKRILLSLFLLLAVASCAPSGQNASKNPDVVVSIPPYVFLVQEIAGDTLTVASALGEFFDPHNGEVKPSQMKMVQNATLFIGVGESYEQKLVNAILSSANKVKILEMDQRVPLLAMSQDTRFVDPCSSLKYPKVETKDLHFWLSPSHLVLQVNVLVEALSELKPEYKTFYEDNGKVLIEQIQALNDLLKQQLRPYEGKAIMISHAALGYFCHDYHLTQIAIECEGKSPLPKDVEKTLALAKKEEVICAFTAPQFDNKGAELIAKDLGVPIYSFNPLAEDILTTLETLGNAIAR
ncbi:MAG: zinc ABC transporter substrate-binding protein [Chlamydiia bacterium]|nr:zinc ABC transporter substrate-binding protein [Chlamydiia bacterium]